MADHDLSATRAYGNERAEVSLIYEGLWDERYREDALYDEANGPKNPRSRRQRNPRRPGAMIPYTDREEEN